MQSHRRPPEEPEGLADARHDAKWDFANWTRNGRREYTDLRRVGEQLDEPLLRNRSVPRRAVAVAEKGSDLRRRCADARHGLPMR